MSTTDEHRLPRSITPQHYRLKIDSDIENATFSGVVRIDALVHESTSAIVMNASGLDIESCVVRRGTSIIDSTFDIDNVAERLTIDARSELASGSITIDISYSAKLDDSLSGYYISTYEVDGVTDRIGVTQFEASFARRAFPCWDEPAFKATYEVSLVCNPELTAVANTAQTSQTVRPDGRVQHNFAPTMVMSTYLVAWAIGRLEISDTVTANDTPIRVIHRPGAAHLTGFALTCAAHALEWFEKYYGLLYSGGKLDLIAVPDFAFGAMENNGCVVFRESLLLIDPNSVTSDELERAAAVIEHEIAHMWFGNLVTMDWWDGIWLNEAFATLMELTCAEAFYADGGIWNTFEAMRSDAFDTDSLPSTRPIEMAVANATETEDMFDVLTYEKGAAVLRMFEQWIGPITFRDGIRSYLAGHAYKNTKTSDLWAALSAVADVNVGEILHEWIHVGGHPTVDVAVDGGNITLSQRQHRVLSDIDELPSSLPLPEPAAKTTWQIPVRYRSKSGDETSRGTALLGAEPITLEFESAPDFFTANDGATGFYRTSSTDSTSRAWSHQLNDLSEAERLYGIDTMWTNLLAGNIEVSEMQQLMYETSKVATSRQVWRRIATAVSEFGRIGRVGPEAEARDLAASLATKPNLFSDRPDGAENAAIQAIYYEIAGLHAGCAEAGEHALQHLEDVIDPEVESKLGSEMDAVIVKVAAHYGGEEQFELIARWLRSAPTPQEELRAIQALGSFGEPELAARFQEMCLSEIRAQNAGYALGGSLRSHPRPIEVWRFIAEQWSWLTSNLPSSSTTRMVGGIRSFWTVEDSGEVLDFFDGHAEFCERRPVQQHLQRMMVNVGAREHLMSGLSGRTFEP